MGTEIKVLHHKKNFSRNKEYFEEPFYCQETPFKVLQELYPKFHITKYNTIEIPHVMIGINSKETNDCYWVYGLSITSFNPTNGLTVSGSLKDYRLDFELPCPSIDKEEFIKNIVSGYLIRKEVIDSGSATENYNHIKKISKYGKQKVIEYINERKKNPNPQKEQNLEDILDYGKVALDNKFDLRILKRMSRRIARKIPTKIEPTNIFYATLRPGKDSLYPQGPKLR